MLVAALAAIVRVTRRSDGLLLEGFSEELFESLESLRAWVGRARCLDSSSFSEMRTANSGSNHYCVSASSFSPAVLAYLGRSYAILIASSSVADVRQRQECAGKPAGALLPPSTVRVQPDAEYEWNP